MDVDKQVEYWTKGSAEDLAAAESLVDKGHLRHGLFFAHLALEKMLKGHATRQTRQMPPKIHGLARLVALTKLRLSADEMDLLREFGVYQIEGRYPDAGQLELSGDLARDELRKARDMLTWLSRQL